MKREKREVEVFLEIIPVAERRSAASAVDHKPPHSKVKPSYVPNMSERCSLNMQNINKWKAVTLKRRVTERQGIMNVSKSKNDRRRIVAYFRSTVPWFVYWKYWSLPLAGHRLGWHSVKYKDEREARSERPKEASQKHLRSRWKKVQECYVLPQTNKNCSPISCINTNAYETWKQTESIHSECNKDVQFRAPPPLFQERKKKERKKGAETQVSKSSSEHLVESSTAGTSSFERIRTQLSEEVSRFLGDVNLLLPVSSS